MKRTASKWLAAGVAPAGVGVGVRRSADVAGIKMREEQSRVGRNEETRRRGERGRREAQPVRT